MNAVVRNVPDHPVEPAALPADDVDTLFSRLKPFKTLALGVSGGADSLCLMVLFSEWRQRANWQGRAEVITIDHRLRTESAEEAQFVKDMAGQYGFPASILCWEGPRPRSNLQESARDARYKLFAGQMAENGAEALLLGHHLNDQAETFLDRLTRGSGVSGLSAMAADETDGPEGLRLLRPFLGIRRERLEASLRRRGLSWRADASNQDRKYKRSRLRRIMELLEDEGLSAERLAETAGHIRRAREALDATVRNIAHANIEHHPAGPARMRRAVYVSLAEDLRLRLLNHLIEIVTGLRSKPRLQKLQALDRALMSREPVHQALSGAFFETGADMLWSWRELGRTPPDLLSEITTSGVWDHRFRYAPSPDAPATKPAGLTLGPLFRAPVSPADIKWPEGWPKAAFDSAPVIWTADGQVYTHFGFAGNPIEDDNHSCVLELARVPIRGKLPADCREEQDFCSGI